MPTLTIEAKDGQARREFGKKGDGVLRLMHSFNQNEALDSRKSTAWLAFPNHLASVQN
jgi:hypothetical protein